MKKERKPITPNELSIGRWIAVLAAALGVYLIGSIPMGFIFAFVGNSDSFMGVSIQSLITILAFVPIFIGFAIAVRFIGKTPLKDFIIGFGGTVSKKACLICAGLFAAGFALSILIALPNIKTVNVQIGQYIFSLLFSFIFIFFQSASEEFLFRGLFIRLACKNKVGYTKKAFLAAAISTVIFALVHMFNPEVTTQSGLNILIAAFAYMIPGFTYFVADLHFGNLLPGIIMHWINNFLLSTLITGDVAALSSPVLLIDATPHSAVYSLISCIAVHFPILIYILIDTIRRKKVANNCNE